jgi:hypothetical protein
MSDLVPFIDTTFRTMADREHRAIAGLSMGAGQALQIGLGNLDRFAYVAGFSGRIRNFNTKTPFRGVLYGGRHFRVAAPACQYRKTRSAAVRHAWSWWASP